MKTILKAVFLLCCAMLPASAARAQKKVIIEEESPKGVVLVTIDKAGDEIIRIMNESQLTYIHEPQAPRFLLTDRKGKFALGIGGYVRATAEYDFGGIVDNIDFIPAYIPNGSKIRNQFQMDAGTSTIFLKLVGHTKILGDFVVYTAGNFRDGSSKGFQLRNAYVSFRDITVGYTYGGFMDLGALPSTIDFQGPDGATFYRATQLAYTYKGLKNFRFNASIEMPSVDGTTNDGLTIAQQRMPDFTAYAQYGWNSKSHLRVGGLIRLWWAALAGPSRFLRFLIFSRGLFCFRRTATARLFRFLRIGGLLCFSGGCRLRRFGGFRLFDFGTGVLPLFRHKFIDFVKGHNHIAGLRYGRPGLFLLGLRRCGLFGCGDRLGGLRGNILRRASIQFFIGHLRSSFSLKLHKFER